MEFSRLLSGPENVGRHTLPFGASVIQKEKVASLPHRSDQIRNGNVSEVVRRNDTGNVIALDGQCLQEFN